jgi:hypothetical protein
MPKNPLAHVRPGDPMQVDAATFNRMVDAAMPQPQRTLARRSGFGGVPITIVNDTGLEVPAGAAMELLPAEDAAPYTFHPRQPSHDSSMIVYPNDGPAIAEGETRRVHIHPMPRFLVASDVEPGATIGAVQDSWALAHGQFGYLVVATEERDGQTWAYCRFAPLPPLLVTTGDAGPAGMPVKFSDRDGNTTGAGFNVGIIGNQE